MSKITLKNVRLSFPSIFKRASFDGKEGKFEATFILNKETDAAQIAMIEAAIEDAIKVAKIKVPSDKRCLKDGDEVEYDGYAGCMSIKAANDKRPTLINRDKSALTEDDNVLYAGCYVNAIIDLWVQNNSFGKRVNANLLGIQFVKDGDSFEGAKVADADEFDAFDDEDDLL